MATDTLCDWGREYLGGQVFHHHQNGNPGDQLKTQWRGGADTDDTQAGAGKCAHAPASVKPGHHGASAPRLHDDGLRVHRQFAGARQVPQTNMARNSREPAKPTRVPAAQVPEQPATAPLPRRRGEASQHRQHRSNGCAEQSDAEGGVGQVQVVFDSRAVQEANNNPWAKNVATVAIQGQCDVRWLFYCAGRRTGTITEVVACRGIRIGAWLSVTIMSTSDSSHTTAIAVS